MDITNSTNIFNSEMKIHKFYRILLLFIVLVIAIPVIFHSTNALSKRTLTSLARKQKFSSSTIKTERTNPLTNITKPISQKGNPDDSTSNARETEFNILNLPKLTMSKEMKYQREEFKFLMTPMKLSWKVPDLLRDKNLTWNMLVIIKSDFKRVNERHAIRQSWGRIRYVNGIRVEVVFVIARASSDAKQIELLKENAEFGDLLQVDLEETYQGIGLKALASMQWIGKFFPDDWLYFSADDDIQPDFIALRSDLRKLMKAAPNYLGEKMPILCTYSFEPLAIPQRGESKWAIGWDVYPYKLYPPFCLGGFYGMTTKLATAIYKQSRKYPYYRMDDVFITGFMRLKVCDTFAPGDFLFDRSDKNCGISTIPNSKFKYVGSNPRLYLREWKVEEDRLRHLGAEIIKS